ncbi:MAG: hypothetical protein U0325_12635 [Polyangiales bacterium]
MPLIVGFNLGQRSPATGDLKAFRVGVEGALGVETSTGITGWSATIALGYVSM